MTERVTVTGMILSSLPIGEYDKRIVLLTKEKGKISAFVRGARRQNSPLLAGTSPFSFGEFTLFEGRDTYTVSQAAITNYFESLMSDYIGAYYGFYFLEFTDYFAKENNDEVWMLKLLYQSLRAVCKENLDNELVRYIFELKAIAINGEAPQVFSCTSCGLKWNASDLEFYFSPDKRGVFCGKCAKKEYGNWKISSSVLFTIQYIISADIEKLYTFSVTKSVLAELKKIVWSCVQRTVDRRMKSLEILEVILDPK